MKDFLVSIILPTFERPVQTNKAVESVLSQTYGNWELLVVDDGSSEIALQALLSYYPSWRKKIINFGLREKSISVLPNEHTGVAGTRNYGVNQSKGDWICFLDSDDLWHKEKLEKQIDFHKQNMEIRISQTTEQWIKNGQEVLTLPKHQKRSGNFFKEALDLCLITPSSVMMKRKLWNETGGFREELPTCEDYDLWLRILIHGEKVGLLNEKLLIRHGGHKDQLSMKYEAIERFRIYSQLQLLLDIDANINPIQEDYKTYLRESLRKRLSVMLAGRKKRNKSLVELEELINFLEKDQLPVRENISFNFLLDNEAFL